MKPSPYCRATAQPGCTMVNRNAGSGTRILIDRLLGGAQPPGYGVQTKSHNAVAVAVAQQRADWGLAIDTVARQYGLGFIPVQEERYDFVVPQARLARAGAGLHCAAAIGRGARGAGPAGLSRRCRRLMAGALLSFTLED